MFQDLLARLGDDEGRRRYLRRSVLWPGTLSCRGGQFVCTILNMSLGGAKVALSDARDCAGGVTLLGDRFEGLPAVVGWQRGRPRSEERRVGKGGGSPFRFRWWTVT